MLAAGRNVPLNDIGDAHAFGIVHGARQREGLAAFADHPIGRAHLEFVMIHLEIMAAEIADGSRSEIPPGTPVSVMVGLVIRAGGRRAAPLVPIHSRGRRLHLGWTRQPAGAISAGPDMNFMDRADGAGEQQFGAGPGIGGAGILDARLGGALGSEARRLYLARLGNGVRDRLGAIDVLVHGQAGQHQVRVPVIRRGDDQGIEVLLLLVEHLPEILVQPGVRIELEHRRGELVVEVAQRHDLFALAAVQVVPAHAADAHAGNCELVAGRPIAGAAQDVPGDDERRQAGGDRRAPGQRVFR